MNIKAEFKNQKIWVDKKLMKVAPLATTAMIGTMATIKGKAQYEYLRGPYPERLSFQSKGRTGSALKNNLQIVVLPYQGNILGVLGIPQLVFYGKIWEAIDEYEHRKGMTFKNDSPMARPFANPAWEDVEKDTIADFKHILAGGLSD